VAAWPFALAGDAVTVDFNAVAAWPFALGFWALGVGSSVGAASPGRSPTMLEVQTHWPLGKTECAADVAVAAAVVADVAVADVVAVNVAAG